jgi:predicted CoA-binding protein
MPHSLQHTTRTIALIGASAKPERPSYGVMQFLLSKGYTVYPVNPGLHGQEILGQPVYVSLAECPPPVDMVDIFRNTDAAAEVIDEAIALRHSLDIKTLWCQLGVTPHEAAKRAEAAGLRVVMNKCPAIEWR